MKRLLTAAVLIPLALGGVFLLPDLWFFWLLGLLAVVPALVELADIFRRGTPSAARPALILGATLVAVVLEPAASGVPALGGFFPVVVVLLTTAALLGLRSAVPVPEALSYVGILVFGCLYIGTPWAAMGVLKRHGAEWVFLLLAIVWLCDSGAYYAGRRFGRRKLARVVSPNKTWEGAVAGTLVALFAAGCWSVWQLGGVEPVLLLWALATAIAGQLGDLIESKIKRGAGVKDSGTLLPGHGGMLDRIDAILLAAPILALALERFGLGELGR